GAALRLPPQLRALRRSAAVSRAVVVHAVGQVEERAVLVAAGRLLTHEARGADAVVAAGGDLGATHGLDAIHTSRWRKIEGMIAAPGPGRGGGRVRRAARADRGRSAPDAGG